MRVRRKSDHVKVSSEIVDEGTKFYIDEDMDVFSKACYEPVPETRREDVTAECEVRQMDESPGRQGISHYGRDEFNAVAMVYQGYSFRKVTMNQRETYYTEHGTIERILEGPRHAFIIERKVEE